MWAGKKMTLASRLKKILKDKNLTQKEAADIIGISAQSLNYIITNDLKTSKLAPKIAIKLGINSDWLLFGKGRPMEPTFYEVPIFNNSFCLEEYLHNNSLPDSKTEFTVIDKDLGPKSFAFLRSKKELIFCYPMDAIVSTSLYLCINFIDNIVEISEEKKEANAYPIYAILNKYAGI